MPFTPIKQRHFQMISEYNANGRERVSDIIKRLKYGKLSKVNFLIINFFLQTTNDVFRLA